MAIVKVFISYRRKDLLVQGAIRTMHDCLAAAYGKDEVFMDIDNIPLGCDFRKVLAEEVDRADVLLALIGPQWLEKLQERQDEARDFVRVEIDAALNRDIPVIPILMGDARMPEESELPECLAELAYRHAFRLVPQDRDFKTHIERLIEELTRHYGEMDDDPEASGGKVEATPLTGDIPQAPPSLIEEKAIDLTKVQRPAGGNNLSEEGGKGIRIPLPARRESPKVGRNDPCPSGSGKKFNACCGRAV